MLLCHQSGLDIRNRGWKGAWWGGATVENVSQMCYCNFGIFSTKKRFRRYIKALGKQQTPKIYYIHLMVSKPQPMAVRFKQCFIVTKTLCYNKINMN